MSNEKRYFDKISEYNPMTSLIESDKVIDIRDEKWAHPALVEGWDNSKGAGPAQQLYNPDLSMEEKRQLATDQINMWTKIMMAAQKEDDGTVDIKTFTAPGCPEEPETPVEVRVYRPKDLKKKKARVIYYCCAGAMAMCVPDMFPLKEIAIRYKCVVVVASYRTSLYAPYPAAINDLHAGYKWMIDNAEMLQINPDNVVIHGLSSGGHLCLALGFRVKRYGYSPKGIVSFTPQTDDREVGGNCSYIYNGQWDAPSQHNALAQWLGKNFASNRIGPEALANHAKVEDCIGYPPTFIHTVEFDPDRDYSREFYGKLLQAQTYAEYHCWGGAHHSTSLSCAARGGELNEYSQRVRIVLDGNIEDCFKYDLRRPWVVEEHKNNK